MPHVGGRCQHRTHGFASCQEAAETPGSPATLEVLCARLEQSRAHETAGIEDHEMRLSKVRVYGSEQIGDRSFIGRIAAIAPSVAAQFCDQRAECGAIAPCRRDPHAGARKTACECTAEPRPG